MGKKIIVTEKPSVAQQFAHALGVSGRHDGYIENNEWVITWCVGHLVTLSYPEKYDPKYRTWRLEDLPFLPDQYKFEVIKDSAKQYHVVADQLNRSDVDVIYNAGDSGREGEYIQRLVYTQAGVEGKKKVVRVWIDSQTDEEILRGIRQAKPEKAYDNLYKAACMRAIEDYAIGINFSRALSCKFGYAFNKRLNTKKYTPIAVGRVMTCVLGLIVQRELEIRNFKKTDYYKIDAVHQDAAFHWKAVKGTRYFDSPKLYNETGLKERPEAQDFISDLSKAPDLTVQSVTRKKEKKNAPLLYNLAELQSDCTKRFKISPDQTLQVAQALYEAKLTTYPRTDARVLSTAISKEISKNIRGLSQGEVCADTANEILNTGKYRGIANTRYCDDSKITDHYAIIPTGQTELSSLTDLQKSIYELIVKRFLSIFMPAAEYSKIEAVLVHSTGEQFFASQKVLTYPGYLALYGQDAKSEEGFLATIKKGDVLPAEFKIVPASTQPPKRYTSGSMILAMENAGKLIEEEDLREQIKGCGIGTSATRAETIKKLVARNYIDLNKKTQILTPTKAGFAVYDIVLQNVPQLLYPKMTASWEKGLSQIESGEVTEERYQQTLYDYIRKITASIKEKVSEQRPRVERKVVGKCPVCGKDLYETDNGYFYCSGYKKNDPKSCRFSFGKELWHVKLEEEDIQNLLQGSPTRYISGFVGKYGPFKERYRLNVDHETGRVFAEKEGGDDPNSRPQPTSVKCPKCKSVLNKTEYNYTCSNHDCDFKVWRKVGGREISEEELKEVLSKKVIGPFPGFSTRVGDKYSGYIGYRRGHLFPVREEIGGKKITPEIVQQLVKSGKTDVMTFQGVKGPYEAFLKMTPKGYPKLTFPKKK